MGCMDGKVALVTGGTGGLGRAAVLALTQAGARVVFSGRRQGAADEVLDEVAAAAGEARFVIGDAASEADAAALVAEAVTRFGRLEAAFNCAGIGLAGAMADITESDFRTLFDTNVWGVAAAMKHQIRAMLEGGGGAIVNASSVAGRVGFAQSPLYTASKHAVEGLTKAAALDYAGRGIRINAIAPAFIATPMVERMVGADGQRRDALAAQHPIGRLGEPDEVAAAVLFLLSDQCPFVIGETLMVDGGWTAR